MPTEDSPNYNAVHVSYYFSLTMHIFVIAFIIDLFREFLTLIVLLRIIRAKCIKRCIAILNFNILVHLFGIVLMHVFRLRHSG